MTGGMRTDDTAPQVRSGPGWRPYGLLVALPPENPAAPGRWPDNTRVIWSGEALRSDAPGETPDPTNVFETRDLSAVIDLGGAAQQSLDLDVPAETFLVGAQLRFERVGSPGTVVTQTGGKLTVNVQRRYDPTGGGGTVINGPLKVVAGPDVMAAPGEVFADLTNESSAVAPGRGSRQYWPDDARAIDRKIRVIVTAAELQREGLPVQPFSLSDSGGSYRLRALALLSR